MKILEVRKTIHQIKWEGNGGEEKIQVELYPKSEADIYIHEGCSINISERSLPLDVRNRVFLISSGSH